ncbi:uncharacterized protein LOC128224159 isoform X2 [Mya arenaria]|uniref:uncharacterized protein LOC128224159 isoform X2 n=1 Tax=Mya arenaria TaxID=6604 RepID=UPI0022E353D2|nr:uncharacterized protein LOC128224159 isoform X2 [Mya arenaria]
MSNTAEKIDQIKKHVRALLISSPVELTVGELRRDFHNFLGEPLDFRSLGYSTCEDFLRDIEDAVQIGYRNGMMTLKAKADETTQHIVRLVSKQNVRNRNKFAVNRQRNRGSSHYVINSRFAGPAPSQRPMPRHMVPPPPMVPANLRIKLKEMFKSFPTGIGLTQFDTAFCKLYGTGINYRQYGFPDHYEFLKSVSDIVKLEQITNELRVVPAIQTPVNIVSSPERSRDICARDSNSMVSVNGNILPTETGDGGVRRRSRGRGKRLSQLSGDSIVGSSRSEQSLPQSHGSDPFGQLEKEIQQVLEKYPNGVWAARFSAEFKAMHKKDFDFRENHYLSVLDMMGSFPGVVTIRRPNAEGDCIFYDARQCVSDDDQEEHHSQQSGHPEVGISRSEHSSSKSHRSSHMEQLERDIQEVLEKHPHGVWAARFPAEFQEMHKKDFDFRESGYLSVINMIESFPDVVKIRRPNAQGDWILYDARLSLSDDEQEETLLKHHNDERVERELRENVKKILFIKHRGIPLKQFPIIYKECTGQDLPIKELGFNSPIDLYISLADSILQIEYSHNGEMLLFPVTSDVDHVAKMENSFPSNSRGQGDGLDQIVGAGCHYVPVMCPDANDYVELFVTNVIHPGLFWVYLRHKDKSIALEELMDELEEEYRDCGDKYQIPEELIKPGLVCATLFPEDNNWHRGVILGKSMAGLVKVYYVDYGNTNFVSINTLKFLKEKFMVLPAQAIQCRMAHIQPNGSSWKLKTHKRLIELTREKALVAFICEIRNQVMSLMLVDTSDSNVDKHLNDILVFEGLAVNKPDDKNTELLDQVFTEAPDYKYVFGRNYYDTPRLPEVANHEVKLVRQTQQFGNMSKSTPVEREPPFCIRGKGLTADHSIHVICMEMTSYLASQEISALLWEDDILTSKLQRWGIKTMAKRIICSDKHKNLFKELTEMKVVAPQSIFFKEQYLTLYKLDDLPEILEVCHCKDKVLMTAVQKFVEAFDPSGALEQRGDAMEVDDDGLEEGATGGIGEVLDNRLQVSLEEGATGGNVQVDNNRLQFSPEEGATRGFSLDERASRGNVQEDNYRPQFSLEDGATAGNVQVDYNRPQFSMENGATAGIFDLNIDHTPYTLQEKRTMLTALGIIRKHFLDQLMTTSSPTEQLVNQLNDCEERIVVAREALANHREEEPNQSRTDRNGETRPTVSEMQQRQVAQNEENQRHIRNILASSRKPIAEANIVSQPRRIRMVVTPPPMTSTQSASQSRLPMMTQSTTRLQRSIPGSMDNIHFNHLVPASQPAMNPVFANLNPIPSFNFGANPGLMPQMNMGLVPQMNPLMFQPIPTMFNGQLIPSMPLNFGQFGPLPPLGRGQPMANVGILPGLIPTVQNLPWQQGGSGAPRAPM